MGLPPNPSGDFLTVHQAAPGRSWGCRNLGYGAVVPASAGHRQSGGRDEDDSPLDRPSPRQRSTPPSQLRVSYCHVAPASMFSERTCCRRTPGRCSTSSSSNVCPGEAGCIRRSGARWWVTSLSTMIRATRSTVHARRGRRCRSRSSSTTTSFRFGQRQRVCSCRCTVLDTGASASDLRRSGPWLRLVEGAR